MEEKNLKVEPPVISEETRKEMARFFAKHSWPKMIKQEKERQAHDQTG